VRSHLVVVGDEPIDLGLELGDRAGGWLTGQEVRWRISSPSSLRIKTNNVIERALRIVRQP